jgi:phosphate uptake regulator
MSEFASSLLEKSVYAVFKEDYETAEEVIMRKEKIVGYEEKVIRSISKIPSEDAMNVRLVAESLRRIAEYSSDIGEIVLNLTISKSIAQLDTAQKWTISSKMPRI